MTTIKKTIPRVLFQTNKKPNEQYVNDMILSKLENTWKYKFYNDEEVIQFFIFHPILDLPDIIAKYNSFRSGAHKADLFRYYYLYVKGGVFLDSDAMIYENIGNVVQNYDFISVESSVIPGTIFQGILGSTPKNEIIKKALYNAYYTDPDILLYEYHYFCRDLYHIVKQDTNNYNIKLYREYREDWNGDKILDDNNKILFMHYWNTKIIPRLYYL